MFELAETSGRVKTSSNLEFDGPETADTPVPLGPSFETVGWGCFACSLPLRMKNDDEIDIFENTKLL